MKRRCEPLRRAERLTSLPLRTVLLVYDRDAARNALKWFLTISGYVVDSVCNGEEAIAVFDPVIHDMVVTDNAMPGMTGVEMAHIIKLRSPTTPVVMYTGKPPSEDSCLDLVIARSTHMLALKVEMDRILGAH
jgi:two-component system alkaline phosphatase synthesis response regulator PhoP